jgi:Flp pilus assembly pilin Flp
MMRLFPRFSRDERGGAAVEFGLIAPLIGMVIVVIAEGAIMATEWHEMRGAVHSGAQFVMGGSRDPATIREVGLASWPNIPAGGTYVVNQVCECDGAAATCGVLCPDKTQPDMYFTIVADADFNNPFYDHPVTVRQVVRVR